MLRLVFAKCFSEPNAMSNIITERLKCQENPKKYYLSEEEKNAYSKYGYFVIEKFFDEQILGAFRQRFAEICNDETLSQSCTIIRDKMLASTNSNPEDYIFKIQDILSDAVFQQYSEDPRQLDVASQLIGEELTALNCMLINKPPGSARHPSHQDAYYFPVRPLAVVASWTAIDPASRSNGCLYCVPGSHHLEILPHKVYQDSKKFFHSIERESQLAPDHKRVYLEMSPGDTVFFHPHLIHGSGANNTKGYRKSMTAHYMNSGCQYVDLEGTLQDSVVKDFKEKVQKNGVPESYQMLWRLKSKMVRGSRSRL